MLFTLKQKALILLPVAFGKSKRTENTISLRFLCQSSNTAEPIEELERAADAKLEPAFLAG